MHFSLVPIATAVSTPAVRNGAGSILEGLVVGHGSFGGFVKRIEIILRSYSHTTTSHGI